MRLNLVGVNWWHPPSRHLPVTITALFRTNFRMDFPFDLQELPAFAIIGWVTAKQKHPGVCVCALGLLHSTTPLTGQRSCDNVTKVYLPVQDLLRFPGRVLRLPQQAGGAVHETPQRHDSLPDQTVSAASTYVIQRLTSCLSTWNLQASIACWWIDVSSNRYLCECVSIQPCVIASVIEATWWSTLINF